MPLLLARHRSVQIYDAFYRLTDPKAQIRSYVFDVIRSEISGVNAPPRGDQEERGEGGRGQGRGLGVPLCSRTPVCNPPPPASGARDERREESCLLDTVRGWLRAAGVVCVSASRVLGRPGVSSRQTHVVVV